MDGQACVKYLAESVYLVSKQECWAERQRGGGGKTNKEILKVKLITLGKEENRVLLRYVAWKKRTQEMKNNKKGKKRKKNEWEEECE